MTAHPRALLSIAIATALLVASGTSLAASPDATSTDDSHAPWRPSLVRDIDDLHILAGKKVSAADLDAQPAVAPQNWRQALIRLPGLLLAEQTSPHQFDFYARGLGDPNESEYVSMFLDGMPLASSWYGDPGLHALPPIEALAQAQLIQSGSALLYGPAPGPALLLKTRPVEADDAFALRSRHIGDEDGAYATFNQVEGGTGEFGYRAEWFKREADGERLNADYELEGAAISLFWNESAQAQWRLDLNRQDSDSGEAGRLPDRFAHEEPLLTTTPFHRFRVERESALLSAHRELTEAFTFDAKLWHTRLDRDSRRVNAAFLPGQLPPNLRANFDHAEYRSTGLDLRFGHEFGDGHELTFGATAYSERSPRWLRSNTELDAEQGDVLRYAQDRDTQAQALFAEAILRFDRLALIPALRIESFSLGIDDQALSTTLTRDPINAQFEHVVPLGGLGIRYDFDQGALQAYGNISQGMRPPRYDDIGNPAVNWAIDNDPDPAKSLTAELGLRGAPIKGLSFDASLFRIDFRDRLETVTLASSEVLRINSGDTRHQGLELSAEYDFLAEHGDDHLIAFTSLTLLDAEIRSSQYPDLVGNTPAYAPDHLAKYGIIWRAFEDRLKLALTGTAVGNQFWRDANTATGNVVTFVAAEIPSYSVFDFSADWKINDHVRVIGGVDNLSDATYTARVRSDGQEPAAARQTWIGIELGL